MKNKLAIFLLFLANTISGISQGISMIAIPWYFVDKLEMPALFAKVFFAAQLVSLVWGTYAGTLVDRHNRKRLFLGENVFGALLFISVGFYGFYTGELMLGLIALCFCCTIFIYNIHYPTLYAFLQEITEPKFYGKITSWVEIQGQFSTMLAGAGAAMLLSGFSFTSPDWLGNFTIKVEAWKLYEIFLLDGLTYLASVFIISLISYQATIKRTIQTDGLFERLKTGFRFLQQNPLIFLFGNVSLFLFATVLVGNYVLMPNYIKNFLQAGANVYALHEAMFAFGAVLAGFFIRSLFKQVNEVVACAILSMLAGLSYFVFAWVWVVNVFLVFVLLLGLANAGSRIMRITYLLKHVPNEVIGRSTSVFMVINVLTRLFFTFLFGLTFFIDNIAWALALFGLGCGIASLVLFAYNKPIDSIKVTGTESIN